MDGDSAVTSAYASRYNRADLSSVSSEATKLRGVYCSSAVKKCCQFFSIEAIVKRSPQRSSKKGTDVQGTGWLLTSAAWGFGQKPSSHAKIGTFMAKHCWYAMPCVSDWAKKAMHRLDFRMRS